MLVLRHRFLRLLGSMAVSPLLYLVAFGYALGDMEMHGRTYAEFLLPGLIAMTSMTQAWAIAGEINIARFYWRIFDEILASPVTGPGFVAGEILTGMTRAVVSICLIISLGLLFGVDLAYGSPMLWAAALLNAWVFSAVAVAVAMLVKSHADQAMMTSFIITPMAFLGGTFFPVDRMPGWAQGVLSLLPLTHAARAVRAAAYGGSPDTGSLALLAGLGAGLTVLAWACVDKAKD
jgi:ABC-type multidrug transport system permease subunit